MIKETEEEHNEEEDSSRVITRESARKSDTYEQVNNNYNIFKNYSHIETKQIEIEEEFNINETPKRDINMTEVSNEEKERVCNNHVKSYYSDNIINTKKETSTHVKRTILIEEKKKEKKKYETQQIKNKINLKKEEKEDNTHMCNATPKKGKVTDSQLTPLKRKAKNVETINEYISLPKQKKLNNLKRNISPLLKSESTYSLNNISFKENREKNKKKTSVYEGKFYLHTPVRGKNKNGKKENEPTQDGIDINTVNEKGEIDGISVNELPEHVKREYFSYLCSPLKRSERIIKTKINKLLNTHKEKKNAEYETKEEEKKEIENEKVFKNSKDVNKMACDFFPEHEEKCWDEFYTRSVDKAKPFTGITTETAVQIITQLLKANVKKIKINGEQSYSPISENDTIMEIGHGTHPLAVEMYKQWGTVGRYIGIEFSGAASTEALNCIQLKKLLIERKIEFVKILNMNYYENGSLNGVVVESNISPKNTKTDFIKMHSFKYIFAKSTLDYITCRLDNTGNSTDWEDDLQISPTVVQMFNSLSDSLQNCTKPNNTTNSNGNKNYTTSSNSINKKNPYIIFVEPSDPAKFRDHILTIFKVIYTATFKYNSSAKYLKLVKIVNFNKASGYMIEKRNEVFKNFEEMREETTKVISKCSYFKYIDDSDWFLPINEPKKWISSDPNDIEFMVNLDNGNF